MSLFKTAFNKLKQGLARTRSGFVGGLRSVLAGRSLSKELLNDLEARMIQADIGVSTSAGLVEKLREAWQRGEIQAGDQALAPTFKAARRQGCDCVAPEAQGHRQYGASREPNQPQQPVKLYREQRKVADVFEQSEHEVEDRKDGQHGASRVEEAAKRAGASAFINDLPNGLQTRIGSEGLQLSGGERQRIAIARAVLLNAPILVLDEATSALDTHTERDVYEALKELSSKRTTLVIAHRLSTVENADQVIVMEKGRIVEQGTHAELIKLDGAYAGLHRMQFRDAEDSD